MTERPRILEVAELDFALDPEPWRFAEAERDAIARHWAEALARKPASYNGRVLLLRKREWVRLPGGALRLEGAFLETDYAAYLAWRDFGHRTEPGENCFSMAALRCADGAFLLGEMAPHTVNAGRIYFPSGTPDPSDVFDGKVDLDASARRELFEETGLSADEATVGSGWTVVLTAPLVACMKPILRLAAEEAKARIDAYLARDPNSELTRMHIIRRPDDIDRAGAPDFVIAYLEAAFA